MKKILFLLFIPFILFSYEDFGKQGFTYKIKEENLMKLIENGVKEIDTEQVKEDLKKQVDKQATGENNLSLCKETIEIKEFDYVSLPENIYTPTGKLYKEKGTKITAYLEQPLDICYVDGTNIAELENQINFFDKETNKQCIFLVSNRNIIELYKKWPERNRKMYPSKKEYEKRFEVKCMPTRVHLIENDRIHYQYSIEKFKHSQEEIK